MLRARLFCRRVFLFAVLGIVRGGGDGKLVAVIRICRAERLVFLVRIHRKRSPFSKRRRLSMIVKMCGYGVGMCGFAWILRKYGKWHVSG